MPDEESLKIQVNSLGVWIFGSRDFSVSILVFFGLWLTLGLPFVDGFIL